MTRNLIQSSLLIASVGLGCLEGAPTPNLRGAIRDSRIENRLNRLGQFGEGPNGSVTRRSFSPEDLEGRQYVRDLMTEAGLSVRVDAAGNLIGRRAGSDPTLPALAFGSHIDSVPEAGRYDGPVGVIGGLEVIEALNELEIRTRHPLELVVFVDEEGSMVGSRAKGNRLQPETAAGVTETGITLADGIRRVGGDPEALNQAILKPAEWAAFLELHVEQGGVLEAAGAPIGIVEGIVGIRWWEVTFEGVANHAGTTPMAGRRDALVAAAQFVLAVHETATTMSGKQVATVGRIQAYPGAPNVIPGQVTMSLEIRDLDGNQIDQLFQSLTDQATRIAAQTGTSFKVRALDAETEPARTDPRIRKVIESAVTDLGLAYLSMPSGAGHDTQNLASRVPVGMIFVPSRGGVSHSPAEYTSPGEIATGVLVLAETLLRLDSVLEASN